MMTKHSYAVPLSRGPLSKRATAGSVVFFLTAVLIALSLLNASSVAGNRPEGPFDYTQLLDFIQMEDRKGPLVEFKQTSEDIDTDLSRENRSFISQNEKLLDTIRSELDSEELRWQLVDATKRLMIVPENHPTYAALFERYCRSVVDYVLQETNLPNPFLSISTLSAPPGELAPSGDGGITAYLVHNIADVYTEEYAFFDANNSSRNIRIKLDNRVYLGEIGSYSSYLVIGENAQYSFERNPYTLWRDSAANPLNVLIAPIEETLHISLRGATENAIKDRLGAHPPSSRGEIEAVIEEWLAIEEAVVGGLVSTLLPGILDRYLDGETAADIEKTFEERQAFDKYRYLDRGIEVVSELGLAATIRIYREHPSRFESLLDPNETVGEDQAGDKTAETPPMKPAA